MNRPHFQATWLYHTVSLKINLSARNNSSIDSADFAKGCPHFCFEMVPFSGACSENTSTPWYYSVLLAHLCVCFCSSHHFCLSPLCCICEIQTLNTNIWKWKHSGSTGLGQKKYLKDLQLGLDHGCVDVKMLRCDLHLHWTNKQWRQSRNSRVEVNAWIISSVTGQWQYVKRF